MDAEPEATGVAGGTRAGRREEARAQARRRVRTPAAGARARSNRFLVKLLAVLGAIGLFVSVALVVLTIAFESAMGRYVDHKAWPQLLEHYAIWHGELWPIVLAWLALTPFVWSRWWAQS